MGYSHESKAYCLWKKGTKKIIKARDIKFFEEINEEIISDPFINLDLESSNEEKSNEKEASEYEEFVDNEDNEDNERSDQENNKMQDAIEETKHGRGRPKILRIGNIE